MSLSTISSVYWILARPPRDQSPDLALVATKEATRPSRCRVPRLVREQPAQVRVIGVRELDRVLLAPRSRNARASVCLILSSGSITRRVETGGFCVADLGHELVHVVELLQCRPADVAASANPRAAGARRRTSRRSPRRGGSARTRGAGAGRTACSPGSGGSTRDTVVDDFPNSSCHLRRRCS